MKPRHDQLLLVAIATILVGMLMISLYTRTERPIETSPPGVIPLQVDDPTTLEQNGQLLTNDGDTQKNQSLQQTQQSPQSPASDLQGSPSTQSTAPVDEGNIEGASQ